jgi:LysR family transcriptional regulator, glycine cleavage system transcriptional activator
MRDLPLHALRAFASVYLHGGVRAAARELRIAHSSVSRHLAELERWLGVKLTRPGVDRRRLAFTPQGEALGKTTLASLGEIAQAAAALREARSSQSVTISAAASFAVRWLLPRLPAFEQAFPRLEISVVVERRLDDPESGGIDLAIRMGRGPWADVRCEPLMDDALYPVMSPAYWKKSGRPREPGDLAGLRLLHDRDPHASWEAWRRAHGPASLDVRRGPRFTSSDLVLRAAAQGQGVALARHRLAQDDLATGALLRPIARRSVDLGSSYWLVTRHQGPDRPAVATVVAWLRREAARHPAAA